MGEGGRRFTLVDCQETLVLLCEGDEVVCFVRGWCEGLFDNDWS